MQSPAWQSRGSALLGPSSSILAPRPYQRLEPSSSAHPLQVTPGAFPLPLACPHQTQPLPRGFSLAAPRAGREQGVRRQQNFCQRDLNPQDLLWLLPHPRQGRQSRSPRSSGCPGLGVPPVCPPCPPGCAGASSTCTLTEPGAQEQAKALPVCLEMHFSECSLYRSFLALFTSCKR